MISFQPVHHKCYRIMERASLTYFCPQCGFAIPIHEIDTNSWLDLNKTMEKFEEKEKEYSSR